MSKILLPEYGRFSQIATLFLLLCLFALIGSMVALFTDLLLASIFLGLAFMILVYRLPELPLVILVMGMPVWRFVPGPFSGFVQGNAVLFTVIVALLTLSAQKFRYFDDKRQALLPKFDKVDFVILLLTLWIWASLLWTPNNDYGLFKALGFSAYTFSIYLVIRWAYANIVFNSSRFTVLMVVVGLIQAIVVLYASIQANSWRPDVLDVSFVMFIRGELGLNFIDQPDALTLGLLAVTVLFLKLDRHRWFLLPVYIFQLWAFLRFQQRGATLALIIGTLFIVLDSGDFEPES